MIKFIFLILILVSCGSSKPKLEKICLDGHEYYYNWDYLAPRMDDDGKPIKCQD